MRTESGTTQDTEWKPSPYQQPLRTWAGHGSGATCNGCGDPIRAHEIEYEIELPLSSSVPTLHFHLGCYRSWTGRGVR